MYFKFSLAIPLILMVGSSMNAADKKPKHSKKIFDKDSPLACLWDPYREGDARDIRLMYELPSSISSIANAMFDVGTVDKEVAEKGTRDGHRVHPLIYRWFKIHANYARTLSGSIDRITLYAAMKSTIEQRIKCFEELDAVKKSHNYDSEHMSDIITTLAICRETIEKDRLRLPVLEAWGRKLEIK